MEVEFHFIPWCFKKFKEKHPPRSLLDEHNSHALGSSYFEMNLADRKMPLLYKQKATWMI